MKLITIENNEPINKKYIQKINNNIIRKKPVVLYFYMEECPYCVKTTNEWNQIQNHINNKILDQELLAIRINHKLFGLLNNVGKQPRQFPNIRYINGDTITHYNKEGVERNAQDLARWIEDKQSKKISFTFL
jgi:thiol-disulfide isomerase/thioredoxin